MHADFNEIHDVRRVRKCLPYISPQRDLNGVSNPNLKITRGHKRYLSLVRTHLCPEMHVIRCTLNFGKRHEVSS